MRFIPVLISAHFSTLYTDMLSWEWGEKQGRWTQEERRGQWGGTGEDKLTATMWRGSHWPPRRWRAPQRWAWSMTLLLAISLQMSGRNIRSGETRGGKKNRHTVQKHTQINSNRSGHFKMWCDRQIEHYGMHNGGSALQNVYKCCKQ